MKYLTMCMMIFLTAAAVKAEKKHDQLLPESNQVEKWRIQESAQHYTPSTLYECINGEAELYHAYGFEHLVSQTYDHAENTDAFITVNIYDMGSSLNAFGVYSNYRYPAYQFEAIGVEAMVSEYDIKFYQGKYFIDISLSDESEMTQTGAKKIAASVSMKIGNNKSKPKITRLLPEEQMIDKTLKYFSKEVLNQAFLPGGLTANYRINEKDATAFVILYQNDAKIEDDFNALLDFYRKPETPLTQIPALGPNGTALTSKFNQDVIISIQNNMILGLYGLESFEDGIPLSVMISRQVK